MNISGVYGLRKFESHVRLQVHGLVVQYQTGSFQIVVRISPRYKHAGSSNSAPAVSGAENKQHRPI